MSSNTSAPTRREWLEAGMALLLVWTILWLADYPRPNVDDGFFAGAAIHLSTTGHLVNPWIAGWLGYLPGVDASRYLVQPPLHPLVMSTWLNFFGVSTASLTGFACALNLLACFMVWTLFRYLTKDTIAAWLATAVVLAWLLFRGLRPESLAVLFGAAGQFCFFRSRSLFAWFIGAILGSAAVISHPVWAIIVVPCTLAQLLHAAPARPELGRLLLMLGAGILLSFLALVGGLGADFRIFIHDLFVHGDFVALQGSRLSIFVREFSVGYDYYINLVVVGLAALGVIVTTCAKPKRRAAAIAALFAAALLVLGFIFYAQQSPMYCVLLAALIALPLLGSGHGWRRTLGYSPALILLCWFGLQHTLRGLADWQYDARPQRSQVAAYLKSAKPGQVVFDATTLRTMFDYRPPAGAVDVGWSWSPGLDDRWWSPRALAARDLWVVNPAWSYTNLEGEARKLRFTLAGHKFASVQTTRGLLLVIGPGLPVPTGLPYLESAKP